MLSLIATLLLIDIVIRAIQYHKRRRRDLQLNEYYLAHLNRFYLIAKLVAESRSYLEGQLYHSAILSLDQACDLIYKVTKHYLREHVSDE